MLGLSGGPAVTSGQALAELLAGNARFVSGEPALPHQDVGWRAGLAADQSPFAVVFGCGDSRVPPELVFDRGLGDLFVVRTAGHVVGRQALGSVEFAVSVLGTPLVVVLGHTSCGAVTVARAVVAGEAAPAGALGELVTAVVPSVRRAAEDGVTDVDGIVDVHVRHTVSELLACSAVVARAVTDGRCEVLGMTYVLDSGQVRLV